MKRLLATAATALLMTTAAQAAASKTYTLANSGYWQTFAMVANDEGVPMCGMQTTGTNSAFYVKWTPTNGMVLQVWKSNWRLGYDQKVAFGVQFIDDDKHDGNTISTKDGWARPTAGGIGSSVYMGVKTQDQAELLKLFAEADRAQVQFPDGNEGVWSMKMDGSRKASQAFMACIYQVQQKVKSAAAPTSPVNPTSPVGPSQPTKPFGKKE